MAFLEDSESFLGCSPSQLGEKGSQEQVSILLVRVRVCLLSPLHPYTLALNVCVMLAMKWVSELEEAGMC